MVAFCYNIILNQNGDYFALDVSHDGGNNWQEIERWIHGDDFNTTSEDVTTEAIIRGPFTENSRLRFRQPNTNASSGGAVYLDNISVEAGTLFLCNDGRQNGDEAGVDCGGSQCAPCTEILVRGDKRYEISNHLGNVMAIITDQRFIADDDPQTGTVFATTPVRTTDYYPFGLEMNKPATEFGDLGDYRFGFNGKEADSDSEWGAMTHYDYGFRIYNPSIGKFLSVDPLSPDYPWYTPYQFAGNKPIIAIDLDGLEEKYIIDEQGKLTKPIMSFMQAAFNYTYTGLVGVTWYSSKDYISEEPSNRLGAFSQSEGPRRKLNREIVDKAFKTHGVITIRANEVVYKDNLSTNSDEYWISLIGHEQSHVEDYLHLGEIGFYVDYGIDNWKYGYRGAFTEYLAYERDKALSNWLKSNPNLLDAISNPFNVNGAEMTELASKEGRRFRY